MKRVNCLTSEQLDGLLSYLLVYTKADTHAFRYRRYYVMTLLMCDAGLRIGEVRQLAFSDLYYNDVPVANIIVRAEIAKGGRSRSIPVSPRLQNALLYTLGILKHSQGDKVPDYAFRRFGKSNTITARAYQFFLANAAMASIGFHISPHTLRHTFADRLRQVTDIRTVQVLLGHKNLSSTQIYTHPNDRDKSEAIAKLNSQNLTGS